MVRQVSRWLPALCVAVVLTWGMSEAHAGVPPTLPYSGALTVEGAPLNGTADLRFELFTGATGGSAVWTEERSRHPVTAGRFSVDLGAQRALAPVLDGSALWLQVTVNGVVMTPRQPVASVPYAFRAAESDALGGFSADDFLRAGASLRAENVVYDGDSVADVNGALNELFQVVSTLQATVASQGEELESLRSGLTAAEEAETVLAERVDDLETRADTADGALADGLARIDAVEASQADVEETASFAVSSIASFGTRLGLAETDISSLTSRVTALEGGGGGPGNGGTPSEDFLALVTRVDGLETRTDGLEDWVDDADEEIVSLFGGLAALESLVQGFDARITGAEANAAEALSVNQDAAELVGRVEDLEDAVALLADPSALVSRVDDLESAVSQLGDTTAIEAELLSLDSRVTVAEAAAQQALGATQDISTFSDRLASAEFTLNDLDFTVGQLQDQVILQASQVETAALNALQARNQAQAADDAADEARTTALAAQSSVDSAVTEIMSLQEQVGLLGIRIGNVEQEISLILLDNEDIRQDIGILDDTARDLRSDVDLNRTSIQVINNSEIPSILQSITTLQGRATTLETRATNLEDYTEDIDDRYGDEVNRLDARIASERLELRGEVDDDLSSLNASLRTLYDGEVGRLDGRADGLDSDVAGLTTVQNTSLGRLDSLESARADIEDELELLQDATADLLDRTAFQYTTMIGDLPAVVFESANVFVRSGFPDEFEPPLCEDPNCEPVICDDPEDEECEPVECPPIPCDVAPEDIPGAGLGNLIVGYGSPSLDDERDEGFAALPEDVVFKYGRHNLIIGLGHQWFGEYGILHGFDHQIEQDGSAAIGGAGNTLGRAEFGDSDLSVIVGGVDNRNDGLGVPLMGGVGEWVTVQSLSWLPVLPGLTP